MIALKLEIDQAHLDRLQRQLGSIPGAFRAAARAAVNDSVSKGRTFVIKAFTTQMQVPRSAIARLVLSKRATEKNMAAELTIRGDKGVSPMHAGAEKSGDGITYRELGRTVFVPRAFFMKSSVSGKTIVAAEDRSQAKRPMRTGSYAGRAIKRGPRKGQVLLRQPVKAVRGTPLGELFAGATGTIEGARAIMQETLTRRLDEHARRLSK